MIEVLCVMGAGAFGALARWGTDLAARQLFGAAFPLGTLIANVLGCFLFGLFMQLDSVGGGFSRQAKLLVTTGFLGAFTTFSTFGFNTVTFIKDGNILFAGINIAANLILGLGAVFLGNALARTIS